MKASNASRPTPTSEWLAAVAAGEDRLRDMPQSADVDLERSRLVITLAELRNFAPLQELWRQLHTDDWKTALAGLKKLGGATRWPAAAAAGALFARTGNSTAFRAAIEILLDEETPTAGIRHIENAALLRCVEHSPALVADLLPTRGIEPLELLRYLAITQPAAIVAETFRAVEDANLGVCPEDLVRRAICDGVPAKWETALACLPHVKHDVVDKHSASRRVITAPARRDSLRHAAAFALTKLGRVREAGTISLQCEVSSNRERAVSLAANNGRPELALEIWRDHPEVREYRPTVRALTESLAEIGAVASIFEVVDSFHAGADERATLLLEALSLAIENGAADEVVNVLHRVPSARDRQKLATLAERISAKSEPKAIGALAEKLAELAVSPMSAASAATRIAKLLSNAKPIEEVIARAALVRVLVRAGLQEATDDHLKRTISLFADLKRGKSRRKAAACVFAATLAADRVREGLAVLQKAVDEMEDLDAAKEFVFEVTETCSKWGLQEALAKNLPDDEDYGVVSWFREVMTWQGVCEGKVDQLVAKAEKLKGGARYAAFSDLLGSLRAVKDFRQALAVVKRAGPTLAATELIHLASDAAANGFTREADEIVQRAVGRKSLSADDQAHALEVRASYLLAGSDEDSLIAFLTTRPAPKLQGVCEFVLEWIKEGSPDFGLLSTGRAKVGRMAVEQAGGLDAAIDRQLMEDQKYLAPELLIEIALYAASEPSLHARVPAILARALTLLHFTNENQSRDPREEIASIAQFVLFGWSAPGFHEKADELFAAIADGYYMSRSHQVEILAALGNWPRAFTLLRQIAPGDDYRPSDRSHDQTSVATLLLLTAPLDALRSAALLFTDNLKLAWLYCAAMATRGASTPQAGLLGRLFGTRDQRKDFIDLIEQTSRRMELAPTNSP